MKSPVKVRENIDLFNAKSFEDDFDIHNDILLDYSSIGRMKYVYPLHLFTEEMQLLNLGKKKISILLSVNFFFDYRSS